MPQSQVVANPWHQEKEESDTNHHVQNTKTQTKRTQTSSLSSPIEVIAMLKVLKKQTQNTQGQDAR